MPKMKFAAGSNYSYVIRPTYCLNANKAAHRNKLQQVTQTTQQELTTGNNA